MDALHEKYENLKALIKGYGSLAVAFSSGVDSTFLLKTAADVLGDQVIAVTAASCSFPGRELSEAKQFCADNHIRQVIVNSEELNIEGFRSNPKNRCYLCKHELFEKIWQVAQENGMKQVAEGSNMDDNGDYRPGLRAVEELLVKSPLRAAQLYKEEIRALSKELGLPTWNKQSFACLSSRFVYGETIDEEKLSMVDRAEQLLLDLGFSQVRVRIHGERAIPQEKKGSLGGPIARIELNPEEFAKLLSDDVRLSVYDHLKTFGFSYVTMDLKGYRTGSMNETLRLDAFKDPADGKEAALC